MFYISQKPPIANKKIYTSDIVFGVIMVLIIGIGLGLWFKINFKTSPPVNPVLYSTGYNSEDY